MKHIGGNTLGCNGFKKGPKYSLFSPINNSRKDNEIVSIVFNQIQVAEWNGTLIFKLQFIIFFQGPFEVRPLQCCDQVLSLISNLITPALEALLSPLSDDEIKATVFQLGATKVPDPNGSFGLFYQQNWNMVGLSLCQAVRSFYDNRYLLKEPNRTVLLYQFMQFCV